MIVPAQVSNGIELGSSGSYRHHTVPAMSTVAFHPGDPCHLALTLTGSHTMYYSRYKYLASQLRVPFNAWDAYIEGHDRPKRNARSHRSLEQMLNFGMMLTRGLSPGQGCVSEQFRDHQLQTGKMERNLRLKISC